MADLKLARWTFEETLRYIILVHSFCRPANVDTEVCEVIIVKGTKILCALGAANLDKNHWPEPDNSGIERRPSDHLALGVGIHACVGQNMAWAEGKAVLAAVANKMGAIELLGEAVWRLNNSIRTLDRLPVTFRAR